MPRTLLPAHRTEARAGRQAHSHHRLGVCRSEDRPVEPGLQHAITCDGSIRVFRALQPHCVCARRNGPDQASSDRTRPEMHAAMTCGAPPHAPTPSQPVAPVVPTTSGLMNPVRSRFPYLSYSYYSRSPHPADYLALVYSIRRHALLALMLVFGLRWYSGGHFLHFAIV